MIITKNKITKVLKSSVKVNPRFKNSKIFNTNLEDRIKQSMEKISKMSPRQIEKAKLYIAKRVALPTFQIRTDFEDSHETHKTVEHLKQSHSEDNMNNEGSTGGSYDDSYPIFDSKFNIAKVKRRAVFKNFHSRNNSEFYEAKSSNNFKNSILEKVMNEKEGDRSIFENDGRSFIDMYSCVDLVKK